MPTIIETTVYRLDELAEDASRDKARAWYRESCLDYDWFESVYEDFERVCLILGVTLATRPVRLFGGGKRDTTSLCAARCLGNSWLLPRRVRSSLDFSVRPDGVHHQWRKVPPRELSIDLVADERLGRAIVWAGAS